MIRATAIEKELEQVFMKSHLVDSIIFVCQEFLSNHHNSQQKVQSFISEFIFKAI